MDEDDKKAVIHDLNIKIGADIDDLSNAYEIELELIKKRDLLQSSLQLVNKEVPTKLSSAIEKAEMNSKKIEELKLKSEEINRNLLEFLQRTLPPRSEVDTKFATIQKLQDVVEYLRSFDTIEVLSYQMKQCNDDEQIVHLYEQLKKLCIQYNIGHRGDYVREYTHYWHNLLKDKFSNQYEEVLKQLKWPISSAVENAPPPKEIMMKFCNLTRYLFLIEEPATIAPNSVSVSCDFSQEQEPCLPVKILLRPLKKRFTFHFTGSRQTARIDRPEWFLTQTLTWIKNHQTFIATHVQPVADKLQLKNMQTVDQFNAGLISFAAERLHTVLGLYHAQGAKGEIVDVDAAFAHAVDETLGFHRELVTVTGKDEDSVLSVLTKAETFVRWLAVEKKYALAKMDEMLGSESWGEAVGEGVSSAVGSVQWVPRAADWFITLLKTIEDRYAVLPQPGHRLQFLELQLELVEEWRIRLTQLLSAAMQELPSDTFMSPAPAPNPLTAIINAAHHTRSVLLQWAHSLHYLQLHYYRRQFQQFTHRQHRDDSDTSSSSDDSSDDDFAKSKSENDNDESLSLQEVEVSAKKLALNEVSRRSSTLFDASNFDITAPIANLAVTEPLPPMEAEAEEAGVFAEAPALLAHLRDAGLAALVEHILLEFKATLRDYKKQKWHAMMTVEQKALSVSSSLCGPLGALCTRLCGCAARLAPALAVTLRTRLAADIDTHIYQEVVLQSWFNTGGTLQFSHDVLRNLIPAFAPPNKVVLNLNLLPKLVECCKLLNMDYDEARRLRGFLTKKISSSAQTLSTMGIRNIPPQGVLQILNQRTDLADASTGPTILELF